RQIQGHAAYAPPAQLFLSHGRGTFRDVAAAVGGGFDGPRVGRRPAVGDFDRDGDVDVLMTTNTGPALLFRTDQTGGRKSVRLELTGTKSNRDAIGAVVRLFH